MNIETKDPNQISARKALVQTVLDADTYHVQQTFVPYRQPAGARFIAFHIQVPAQGSLTTRFAGYMSASTDGTAFLDGEEMVTLLPGDEHSLYGQIPLCALSPAVLKALMRDLGNRLSNPVEDARTVETTSFFESLGF
jgi:hypothetical protein